MRRIEKIRIGCLKAQAASAKAHDALATADHSTDRHASAKPPADAKDARRATAHHASSEVRRAGAEAHHAYAPRHAGLTVRHRTSAAGRAAICERAPRHATVADLAIGARWHDLVAVGARGLPTAHASPLDHLIVSSRLDGEAARRCRRRALPQFRPCDGASETSGAASAGNQTSGYRPAVHTCEAPATTRSGT